MGMHKHLSAVTHVALAEYVESREVCETSWQVLCSLANGIGDLAGLLGRMENMPLVPQGAFEVVVGCIVESAAEYAHLKGVNVSECERCFISRERFHGSAQVELTCLLVCLGKLFACPIKGIEMSQALRGVFFSTRAILAKYYPRKSLEDIIKGEA
jgi:hypothetical protein